MEPGEKPKQARNIKPYPAELQERAVRLVLEHLGSYESDMEAIRSVAGKMGMHPDTLRIWVRRSQADAGKRSGDGKEDEELRQLRREVKELRRANEILKSASVFFATELDGRRPA